MHKIHNKNQKQQPNCKSHVIVEKLPLSPQSRPSLSLSSLQDKLKFKLLTKMSESLKPLGVFQKEFNSVQFGEKTQRGTDFNNFNNLSMRKSKKMSESHYYEVSKKEKDSGKGNKNSKRKASGTQLKSQSIQRHLDYKSNKSKLQQNRKISKAKQQPRANPQCSTKNLYSVKRLMSSTQMSQQVAKLQTVRTFSPEMQWISSQQLSHRKKQNKIVDKEAELINRIQKVLDEYQKAVIKQQKQKEILIKQNRKLKQKIQIMHSEKKYKTVFQYKI